MANEHGGHRVPEHPAAASGPGSLSARTDGAATQAPMIAPGNGYGERKSMQEIQGGAPMAANASGVPSLPSEDAEALRAAMPFGGPSLRPDEPITTGVDAVPGMQPSSIDDSLRERLSTALPMLAWLASQPRASEQTRQFVRQLRGDI